MKNNVVFSWHLRYTLTSASLAACCTPATLNCWRSVSSFGHYVAASPLVASLRILVTMESAGKGNVTSDPSSPRSPRLATLVRSPSAHSLNVTLNDEAKFKKLNYWEQWDALCASMTEPDPNPVKLLLYFVGAALCAMNIFVVYTLTRWAFPGASFAEAFVKNLIAWTGLAYQNGFEMAIHLLTHNMGCRTKWKLGSIKLSSFGYDATKRRSPIDLAISLAFSLSRLYMIASPRPTAMCAWTYFLATAALAATDFGQFTASYGFLHGPWSVYMLAKYTGATGALALLQLQLIVMYVGCGVGKMGPWFTQVFNQEWPRYPRRSVYAPCQRSIV